MHRLHNLALYFYNLLGIPYSKLLRLHRRSADICFDLVILFLQYNHYGWPKHHSGAS